VTAVLEPRVVKAGNRGPFTLDGTRTFLVGREDVAVLDPGPNVEDHVRALLHAVKGTQRVRILLTHGHSDHAGSAESLAMSLECPVYGPPSTGFLPLGPGQVITTDEGDLHAVATPGHTRDHLAYFWPRGNALFAGDLILGRGATTWLGEYSGCVADYLATLERVEALGPGVIYPAHGAPVRSPGETLEAYRAHRVERLRQLEGIRRDRPEASVEELLLEIYGPDLPPGVAKAARASIEVMLHHLGMGG